MSSLLTETTAEDRILRRERDAPHKTQKSNSRETNGAGGKSVELETGPQLGTFTVCATSEVRAPGEYEAR